MRHKQRRMKHNVANRNLELRILWSAQFDRFDGWVIVPLS